MSFVVAEIATQPQDWRRAAELAEQQQVRAVLPQPGERVAVVGCGTSLFMAQAIAGLREAAGQGETDAFTASEFPAGRRYDRILALTRSGTTTEILHLLGALPAGQASTVITTGADLPAAQQAGAAVVLDFADERSVVQTRFATTALALMRRHLGGAVEPAAADAAAELDTDLDPRLLQCARYAFLGTGWTVGLANEAALKLREAAQAWTESYPAMEYRHGPISVADGDSAVWIFGPPPAGLVDDIERTGALVVQTDHDPMALLVRAQRLAAALAVARGLDPDAPRNLTRSIVLPAGA